MEYTIGKYKFDDEGEYQKALKEAALIKSIRDKYDLKDIGMVKKFLILVKQGKLSFTTAIGKDFVSELKDIYIGLSLAAPTPAAKAADTEPVPAAKAPEPAAPAGALNMPVAVPAKSSGVSASAPVVHGSYDAGRTTGPKGAPRDRSKGAVFFYCFVPLIVFGVILLVSFVSSFPFINTQLKNFMFIATLVTLYLIAELMMTIVGLRYKKYKKEIREDHLAARICIPKKLFIFLILAMVALAVFMFVKPFLTASPSAEEKVSFRNEVIR